VVDTRNNALQLVSKADAVRTLTGGLKAGFADGQGTVARFDHPLSVVVTDNCDFVMTDFHNLDVRVVTPGGAVRTLACNGQHCFVDGQGTAAHFNNTTGLTVDVNGSFLVTEYQNNAVLRVTMEGAVSTVAGNGGDWLKKILMAHTRDLI
jgi:hypothetical protein